MINKEDKKSLSIKLITCGEYVHEAKGGAKLLEISK